MTERKKPRCQECGGTLNLSCNAAGEFLEGHCIGCGEIWNPQKGGRTRARKRFELVKTMADSENIDHDDWVGVEFVVNRADRILAELYGEDLNA